MRSNYGYPARLDTKSPIMPPLHSQGNPIWNGRAVKLDLPADVTGYYARSPLKRNWTTRTFEIQIFWKGFVSDRLK